MTEKYKISSEMLDCYFQSLPTPTEIDDDSLYLPAAKNHISQILQQFFKDQKA